MDFSTKTFDLFTRGLAHEDPIVRDSCLRYFDRRPDGTLEQTAAILEAIERFGVNAFRFPHGAYALPLDDAAFSRLKTCLGKLENEEFHLRWLLWTANAPTEASVLRSTQACLDELKIKSPGDLGFLAPKEIRACVSRRLVLKESDEDELLGMLQRFLGELDASEQFPSEIIRDAEWALEELVAREDREKMEGLAKDWLSGEISTEPQPDDWQIGFGIFLAGRLGLESSVDRLIDCFALDWDWTNEAIQRALTEIGTPEVTARIRERWFELPDHGRLFLSSLFESRHPDGYLEFYDTALEREEVWYPIIASTFGVAAAHLGSKESLEWALRVATENPFDRELEMIRENLFVHYELRGFDHSKKAEFRKEIEAEDERLKKWMGSLDFPESLLPFGSSEPTEQALDEHWPTHGGTIVKPRKVGRNDPCPCGSGKKYKKCCLA